MKQGFFEGDPLLTVNKREVLAYWQSAIGKQEAPFFGDFDLLEVASCLPNIVLFEVKKDPQDFTYRLVGSTVDLHNTEPFTGKHMSELPGKAPGSTVWNFFGSIVESCEPALREMPYVGRNKDFERIEILALPLLDDQESVSHIVVVTDYFSKAQGRGTPQT